MDLSNKTTRWSLYGCGLLSTLVSLYLWVYWYYPMLGHDLSSGVPEMYQMRDAFVRFGRIDIDFSPFRCLGLPVFSNPNSVVWSFFHLTALFFSEVGGLYAATAIFMVFGYVGCLKLTRGLGFRADLATLLSVGWCLQGFCVTHTLPGHLNYVQFCLFPLFLWILLQKKPSWIGLGAVAFWLAHFLYTSGYYLLLIGVPSVLTAAFFLEWLMRERLAASGLGGFKTAFRNLMIAGPVAIAMCFPKILGVFNFTALFPRLMQLERIDPLKALVYTLGNYFYPFPYDVHLFTGWWYGNWESYEFILPGLVLWLGYLLMKHRRAIPVVRVLTLFGVLTVVGMLLSSGLLGPLFESLPLFKSLHVNPRWNSFVLLPFFTLALATISLAGYSSHEKKPRVIPTWLLAVFGAAFFVTPLLFIDKDNMQIGYPDRAGINFERHQLTYCYEPLFGYRLENFPLGAQTNWMTDSLVDPRCYLKSNHCQPGTIFGQPGTNSEDYKKLQEYSLRDEYAPVKNFKWLALLIYFAGLGCAIAWLARSIKELLESDD